MSNETMTALFVAINTIGLLAIAFLNYQNNKRQAETKTEVGKVLEAVNGPLTHALKTVERLTAEKAAITGLPEDIIKAASAAAVVKNREAGYSEQSK